MSNSSLIENDSFTYSFTVTEKSNSLDETDVTLSESQTIVDDDSMSYDSLTSYPSRPGLSHFFNSFNNAAQSTRRVKNTNKRSFLFRGLFGRSSSKKYNSISGGDHPKATEEQPYYDINLKGDLTIKPEESHDRFEGLRYDFQQIKSSSMISTPEIKSPSSPKSQIIHAPPDQSLSSVSDPASMRRYHVERKQPIQSAHATVNMLKLNSSTDKSLFNGNQHKYQIQAPIYQHPKPISAVELLAKKYASTMVPRTSTGLFWYNPNQNTMSPNPMSISNKKNRFHLSSNKSLHSIDTSSDSNTSDSSSNSTNDATVTGSVSRSSSSSSNSSHSTRSTSSSKTATTMQNRSKNKKKDLIQIDLNSTTSRSSSSTKSNSSSTSSSSSSSSSTVPTNNNRRSSKIFDIFSSGQKLTMGKFKVKRQRIETNLDG